MKKIYKYKDDPCSPSLTDKLKAYEGERIQKFLPSRLSLSKGSLAILAPLAAVSLLSSDVNAQCGDGTASFNATGGMYGDGQVDVDGDGNPDFDFDIVGSNLFMTPIGTMSMGTSGNYMNALSYGQTIDGAGNYNNSSFYSFNTTLNSGSSSTVYVPVRDAAGHLGFVEIQFDGAGGFTVGVNNTGVAFGTGDVTAGNCASLPVELVDFNIKLNGKNVVLSWKTASELNNDGFEIQRSSNGRDFYKIGWIEGAGTVHTPMSYDYTDQSARPNETYYYRLKQMDFDGRFEYSSIVSAKVGGKNTIAIGSVYPNPVVNQGVLNLAVETVEASELSWELITVTGQTILAKTQEVQGGLNEVSIVTPGVPDGTYFLKITVQDTTKYEKVVIKK